MGAALLGACGGSSPPSTVRDAVVAFEADWQCERERHAFDELADLAARFESTRDAAGITVEEYEAFREVLADDAALRQDVLAAYRLVCG